MIVGRSKSQQEIDAQIGRLADEFQKGESSVGIHELERDADRNYEGLGVIWPGDEYLDRRPIPKASGGDEVEKHERSQRRREGENPSKLNWI